MTKKIRLTKGIDVDLDEDSPKELFEIIIKEILIPKYQKTDDFNLSINVILEEMNRLIINHDLNPKLKIELLNEVERQLDKEIEELTGVGKIEILFLDMDDYVEDIKAIILSGKDKQEIRNTMAELCKPLTLYELGELFIYLGKRAFLN